MNTFRAACVQLRSTADVADNVRVASTLIREAKAKGADFVTTPENTALLGGKVDQRFLEADDPALPAFCALAEELGIWLLIGSLTIRISETKMANRSFLIDPKRNIAARYDKIHLFDVDLSLTEKHRESDVIAAGNEAVVANLPWGKLGLSICYDLRFPQLYRALAKAGAFALTIPASFTETTGKAHWHVLLRARAIENGAFVIAPAQGGHNLEGRGTYGHSLIIAPWGEILAEADKEPCVIVADIDPAAAADARARIPNLRHDRAFSGP